MNIAPSLRCERAVGNAGEETRHRADLRRLQRRRYGAHVVGVDARVAVGEDQRRVAHEPHHREHVGEFRIARAGDFADVDVDAPIRATRRRRGARSATPDRRRARRRGRLADRDSSARRTRAGSLRATAPRRAAAPAASPAARLGSLPFAAAEVCRCGDGGGRICRATRSRRSRPSARPRGATFSRIPRRSVSPSPKAGPLASGRSHTGRWRLRYGAVSQPRSSRDQRVVGGGPLSRRGADDDPRPGDLARARARRTIRTSWPSSRRSRRSRRRSSRRSPARSPTVRGAGAATGACRPRSSSPSIRSRCS